jgi:hypothetical protein
MKRKREGSPRAIPSSHSSPSTYYWRKHTYSVHGCCYYCYLVRSHAPRKPPLKAQRVAPLQKKKQKHPKRINVDVQKLQKAVTRNYHSEKGSSQRKSTVREGREREGRKEAKTASSSPSPPCFADLESSIIHSCGRKIHTWLQHLRSMMCVCLCVYTVVK